jgi:hypothetical protein
MMQTDARSYTVESVLAALGYPDPLVAARQHARMILLGRLARYQATIRQMEVKWNCSLDEMRTHYMASGMENHEADDDYVEWQWYTDAIKTVNTQLAILSEP